ncbi:hypothetical protein [Mucilaginibacter ginsenosidivorax]|uniref:Uncharacterized protein n=1 Tax=Mucilaginibacter ginsenosidivorax TaxID=862126 RepID=A0A5B8W3I7_9SPHI|nr:hypothetical protein [Mucilaginibacter ginsenosidivorax]QEC76868.1 hypothetical protein FSB76_13270 [Mucilaginibacter ginsenosidivorax]
MNRDAFIKYLTDNGCVVVRNANQGYSVVRNVMNGKISGVPKEEEVYNITACRICKTLEVDPPKESEDGQGIVDLAHKNHGSKE